jgi:tripartite-type tricarboxylate transporter receptor subunit TctC
VKNVKELVALAKTKPGQLTFGSAGVSSNSHLSGELFKVLAGVDMVHVPYKGSALATNALVSGETTLGFSNAIATLPHVRSGRLRLLAVTPAKRSRLLPDVPTIAEAGVPGFENIIWSGIVVHSATPKAVQSALHDLISRTIESPEITQRLARDGSEPFSGDTPQQYASFIRTEIEKWRKVVQMADIQPQ